MPCFAQCAARQKRNHRPRSGVQFEQSFESGQQPQHHGVNKQSRHQHRQNKRDDFFAQRVVRIGEKADFKRGRITAGQPMLNTGFTQNGSDSEKPKHRQSALFKRCLKRFAHFYKKHKHNRITEVCRIFDNSVFRRQISRMRANSESGGIQHRQNNYCQGRRQPKFIKIFFHFNHLSFWKNFSDCRRKVNIFHFYILKIMINKLCMKSLIHSLALLKFHFFLYFSLIFMHHYKSDTEKR